MFMKENPDRKKNDIANILAENFISYVNEFVWTRKHSFCLKEISAQCLELSSNLLIMEVKNKKHKYIILSAIRQKGVRIRW